MKNLANCCPSDFFKQTVKIKDALREWFEITNILEIRNKKPEFKTVPAGASPELRAQIIKTNAMLLKKQSFENVMEIIDNAFDKHPQETVKLLAMCCFIEPEDADNHPMSEYLGSIMDMLEEKQVTRFFSFVAGLQTDQKSIQEA